MAAPALAPASVAFGKCLPAAQWTRWQDSNKVLAHLQSLPLPPGYPYWNFKEACKIAAELGCDADWHGGLWREMQPFLPTRSQEGEAVRLAASSSVVSSVGHTHIHDRGVRCPVCPDPVKWSHGSLFGELSLACATPTHATKGRRSCVYVRGCMSHVS